MRGRKPIPTAMKVLAGNPGKRRLNTNEPKPAPKAPPKPTHFDREGNKAWKWLTGVLGKNGLLAESDQAIITIYCDTWSQYVAIRKELAKKGAAQFILRSDKGAFYRNPLVDTESMLKKQLMTCLSELGLSPTSRVRLHAIPQEQPADSKAKFFKVVG